MIFKNRFLDRIQLPVCSHAFNRYDFSSFHGTDRHQTGSYCLPVQDDRTGPAFSNGAAFLGSCKLKSIPEHIQKPFVRICLYRYRFFIYDEIHFYFLHLDPPIIWSVSYASFLCKLAAAALCKRVLHDGLHRRLLVFRRPADSGAPDHLFRYRLPCFPPQFF